MRARDIMTRPVVAATAGTNVRELAVQMLLGGFSGLPVTDTGGTVEGIVTEIDVIRVIRDRTPMDTVRAGDIMTRNVITADVDTPVTEIMEILEADALVRVPITENGRLKGIVSRSDVLRNFIEPKFLTFE